MTTGVYSNNFSEFIGIVEKYRNSSHSFKLYLKQWEFELFMKHHLLDGFTADRIVIVPDFYCGGTE